MITKGIIVSKSKSNSNKYLVRIPIFESAGVGQSKNELSNSIVESTLSHNPGTYNALHSGDVVFIGFEDNKYDKPIILGKLFVNIDEESRGYQYNADLRVTKKAVLPADTTIGDMPFDNILNYFAAIDNQLMQLGIPKEIPIATSDEYGVVKLGSDTVQTVIAETPSYEEDRTYAIQVDTGGKLVVNVPWIETGDIDIDDVDGLQEALDDKVDKNPDIIGSTHTKITYDSKGLVTTGEDLNESDIPELPQSKITNLETDLGNKATKLEIEPFSVPYRKSFESGEPNSSIEVSQDAEEDTIARRYTGGRLGVGNAENEDDAVNLYVGDQRYLQKNLELGTYDLNDVVYEGLYYQATDAMATVARNYPTERAGSLQVLKTSNGGVAQIYITYRTTDITDGMYIRKYSSSWSTWTKVATEDWVEGKGYVTSSGITSASLTTGTANGTIRLTTNGSTGPNVSVYGLGNLAYLNTVSNSYLGTVAQNTIKGRVSNGSGGVEDLSVAQVKTMLSLNNVTNESKATMFTSPVFTGTPTAPTPTTGDNSTKVATTAFVQNRLGIIGLDVVQPSYFDFTTPDVKPGLYSYDSFAGTAPWNRTYGTILNMPYRTGTGNRYLNQIAIQEESAKIALRNYHTSSGWGPWYEIYHEGYKPTASDVGARPSNWNPSASDIHTVDQDTVQNELVYIRAGGLNANSITNAKLATVATNTIKGRKTAGTGNVEDLSMTDVQTMLKTIPYETSYTNTTVTVSSLPAMFVVFGTGSISYGANPTSLNTGVNNASMMFFKERSIAVVDYYCHKWDSVDSSGYFSGTYIGKTAFIMKVPAGVIAYRVH